MEELVKAGKVRAIGVSNYNKFQLDRLMKNCTIKVCLWSIGWFRPWSGLQSTRSHLWQIDWRRDIQWPWITHGVLPFLINYGLDFEIHASLNACFIERINDFYQRGIMVIKTGSKLFRLISFSFHTVECSYASSIGNDLLSSKTAGCLTMQFLNILWDMSLIWLQFISDKMKFANCLLIKFNYIDFGHFKQLYNLI